MAFTSGQCACGLTLPSSGPAYGGPLKSNVRPQLPKTLRSMAASVSRPQMPALPRTHPPMSRFWRHRAAHAFDHRRASVARSARAVRPLAASARDPVFQALCAPALPGKVGTPLRALSRRTSSAAAASELIGRLVSRKVRAMRPRPNPNTNQKVSTHLRRALSLPSCAFGSVSARPLPVVGFGTRGGPNHSFKRTCLRHAA